MNKFQFKTKIIKNQKISDVHYHLTLEKNDLLKKAKPGQFVHVQISEGLDPYFRRPFGIYRLKESLEVLYAVVGNGTRQLSRKQKGEELDILGPLGNHFTLPSKGIKQVVMVAGAVGIAPFLMLSDFLADKGYELILLYGARTRSLLFDLKEFKKNGCKIFIATDDGSFGVEGRVSELYSKIDCNPDSTYLYACGPKPMLHSVVQFAQSNNLKGQVSEEEVMACGIGVCLGCATKMKSGYKTVCHDGPVFDMSDY